VFFVLLLDNMGIPIPSEATLALAGNLAKTGEFNIFIVIALGTIAQTLGTYIAYLIGKYGGEPIIKRYGKYLLISAHDYKRAEVWFAKRGSKAIFVSRLIPVIRSYAGFAAGAFDMDVKAFLRDSFLGSLVWSVLLAGLGYWLGDSWKHYYGYLHYVDYLVIIVVVVVIARFVYTRIKRPHNA
jgi:membrane protein DedA with SNARE-associated domain